LLPLIAIGHYWQSFFVENKGSRDMSSLLIVTIIVTIKPVMVLVYSSVDQCRLELANFTLGILGYDFG